jgi:hypothetical protein
MGWDLLLASGRHRRADAGDLAPGQERVPVDPLEGQLPEVVEARLAQERQTEGGREVPRQRLGLVVKSIKSALRKPVSMKQLAWPSYPDSSSSPETKRATFSASTSASKCVTEPAFEVGRSVASPSAKTFGLTGVCSVRLLVGTKPSASPRPGERST